MMEEIVTVLTSLTRLTGLSVPLIKSTPPATNGVEIRAEHIHPAFETLRNERLRTNSRPIEKISSEFVLTH